MARSLTGIRGRSVFAFSLFALIAACFWGWQTYAQKRGLTDRFRPEAIAADGDLDTAFHDAGSTKSPNGVNRLPFGLATDTDIANGIGIQTGVLIPANAGKIVIGGNNLSGAVRNLALARYTAAGALDSANFGASGKVLTSVLPRQTNTTSLGTQMLAIDPTDDGIVIISEITNAGATVPAPCVDSNPSQWLITRYTSNGTLDVLFNPAGAGFGVSQTGSPGHRILDLSTGCRNFPTAVVVRPDGEIVVVGFTQNGTTGTFQNAIALVTKTGAPDAVNFTSGGIVKNSFTGDFWAVSLDGSGKYVVAGTSGGDFMAARFTSNGTLDTANFNNPSGFIKTNIGGSDTARSIAIQPLDGKIIVGGDRDNSLFAVARYNPNGTIDAGFGTSGFTTTSIGSGSRLVNSVSLTPNRKIIVTGRANVTVGPDQIPGIGITRYNPGGILDTSFGTAGKVVTQLGVDPSGGNNNLAETATTGILQSDGKILVAGEILSGDFGSDPDMFVARFQNNSAFTTAGSVSVSGRVLAGGGRGLTNALVTMTGPDGGSQTVMTGRSGVFSFDGVESGKTYIISVGSRRFSYSPQSVPVSDSVAGLVFTPE